MVAVNYLWSPINDNIVREFDDAGNASAEYTTEPDLYGNVVSQYRSGQTSYLHSDGQGSTTELTNEVGTVTDTIRSSAFGEVTERTGPTELPFQYIGQRDYFWDNEMGEYSVRQRPMHSTHGRWLTKDPVEADNGTPYSYVANSPVNSIDPSGLIPPVPCTQSGETYSAREPVECEVYGQQHDALGRVPHYLGTCGVTVTYECYAYPTVNAFGLLCWGHQWYIHPIDRLLLLTLPCETPCANLRLIGWVFA